MITYAPSDEISQALEDFSLYNTDRKAQIVAGYVQTGVGQVSPFINNSWMCPDWVFQSRVLIIMFYDGGFQPAVYQPFLDIPALASNVDVHSAPNLLATIDIVSTCVFNKLNDSSLTNM